MKRKILYWAVLAAICLAWVVPSALAATAGKVVLDPNQGKPTPGTAFDVKVVVKSVQSPGGLYGGQFKVSFDKTLLELVGVDPGGSMGTAVVQVPVDVAAANANGLSSLYGVALKDAVPELSKDVELAVLHLKWKQDIPTTTKAHVCLELLNVALGDRDAKPIPFDQSEPIQFQCASAGNAKVKGYAYLWAKDHSGSTVTVGDTANGTTDVTGYYEVKDVAMGEQSVKADADGYLSAFCANAQINWTTTVLKEVTLIPGDVNGDDVIDIVDATAIGLAFGQTTTDKTVDLNRDGTVDVYDLILLSRNFGTEGPSDWACVGIDPESLK
jgi:hypothetical protein